MIVYLIWSFEHNAWWGPGECGYVEDADAAGHYTQDRAMEICRKANIPAIHEAVVPLPEMRAPAKRPTTYVGGWRR